MFVTGNACGNKVLKISQIAYDLVCALIRNDCMEHHRSSERYSTPYFMEAEG
jgi:hypothetical protein